MKFFKKTILALATTAVLMSNANACTGIELKAKDGTYVNGRTLEFAVPVNPAIYIIPRNFKFLGTLPDGSAGMSYTSKYQVIGGGMMGTPLVLDGMNEAGLSAAVFYFPGYAGYGTVTDMNKRKALSPVDFNNWLLTQFASVADVKKGLDDIVIAATPFKAWGMVPPFHYVVYDKTGQSIVIEPINGKLVVYDNPLGIITNSPTFDWQMTNLKNYVNLSPLGVPQATLNGVQLQQFGQGSGLHGLPGDFSPPSRFVRAALFSSTALPSNTGEQTVMQAFHILNQFDIPLGSVRSVENGNMQYDYTMLTSVKDPQNQSYYFKTYGNQNIEVIHLNNFNQNATRIQTVNITNQQTQATDISSTLTNLNMSGPAKQ